MNRKIDDTPSSDADKLNISEAITLKLSLDSEHNPAKCRQKCLTHCWQDDRPERDRCLVACWQNDYKDSSYYEDMGS